MDYEGPGGSQSSFNFPQSSFSFIHSPVLIFYSPVLVLFTVASWEVESSDSATTGPTFSSRTVNRISGLLNPIRNHGSNSSNKKRKIVKEHRIQVRWCHYIERKKEFITVWQKNGGANRFIPYTDEEPIKLETLTEKARELFFPDGKNNFAGRIQEMNTWICKSKRSGNFRFSWWTPFHLAVGDQGSRLGIIISLTRVLIMVNDLQQRLSKKVQSCKKMVN